MSEPFRLPPHTPPATPRALGARTTSMGAQNVEAATPRGFIDMHNANVPSRSPDAHHRMLQRAHSQPSTTMPDYHFSPRRKRVMDTGASPRRFRRRLFFADAGADTGRDRGQRAQAAAAVIRESVETGDAHVDLSDLDLDEVPDELAELKHLVVLAPSGAMVTDVQVTLGSNALRGFPLALCELDNLTTLILSHNRIEHVPPEIGNLRNLRELSVAHNRVRVLPAELAGLRRLHTLSVFPNPFLEAPERADARMQRALRRELWPCTVELRSNGVPRLADLAARQLTRAQLLMVKQRLVQCVDGARPALGRVVGAAEEPDGSLVSALRAQHVELERGHTCAACGRWFLVPPVVLVVWAPLSILTRPAPFRVRLCGRDCMYADALTEILARPLQV
ncbi:hypothetical protein IWW50_002808 [Coemansia erecta]|nr:hypothetical protein GGF43_000961 [Coemansia sp. RSA 2618]KAJ2825531.1 hypothetical protein IWW50_002808 [Coemansia erecta]